jgi:hypothetical protein
MNQRDLKRIWNAAARRDRRAPLGELRGLLGSRRPAHRLLGLVLMRQQLATGTGARSYLRLARPLVADRDNTCRWQALIVVAEFIAAEPEAVWRVVQRYGRVADADLRAGISSVLLEHLLDQHARRFIPRVRAELQRGNAAFADTVARCWSFGRRDVQRLIDAAAA